MRQKAAAAIVASVSLWSYSPAQAWAQVAAGASSCRPAVQPAAAPVGGRGQNAPGQGQAGPGAAAPRVPREVTVTAIPGVVAAGSTWTKVWQAGGNSADGILTDVDGHVLVAQEDFDAVLKIDQTGQTSVFVSGAKGVGSLSMDRQGRLYGVHRTERPGSTKPDLASIVNAITLLSPARAVVADKWSDGTPLSVRPNDLAADSQGGAYFTSGCVFYASPDGIVTVVAEDIRTNGILFSEDDKTLYVTNGGGGQTPATVVAFDVLGPGRLAGRREFATLTAGNGDGLALDAEGRLYVTSNPGVQVFDKTGRSLGLIPTPRGVIKVAFAGPDKRTLYVVGSGAEDAGGQPIREGPQQTAATVFRLPMVASGVAGRAK